MKRPTIAVLGALSAAAALTLAACGSSSSPSSSSSSTTYNEGLTSIVNPSNTSTNKTLIFDSAVTPDSTDPDNTYYAFNWDFVRLYTMSLMTYKSCPGSCGLQLEPQLATGPGTVSDNGLIWTYHIKPNVKFQNGVTVTSQDVKYGVERTFAKNILPNGPVYYQQLLNDPSYPGPYTDPKKNLWGLTSVTTPNSTTIQ
jgi:peptide/nickel transport system substrate-binding protein